MEGVSYFSEDEDVQVLKAEIREEFPELPGQPSGDYLRDWEKTEMVTVKKIGLQNQIELKSERKEACIVC